MTPDTTSDPVEVATEALRNVWDPELAIDVVSLGLIYDIRVDEMGLVVDMTLTTPGCPVSEQLPSEAAEAVRRVLPQYPVRLDIVWEPLWTPERMSEDALVALGFRK
jgi:metal-sulfur cluster biosynthetic enzyme